MRLDGLRAVVAAGIAVFGALAAPAFCEAGTPLPLWRIDGDHNRVYLLGSVHLLRESDYPIPAPIYDAYEDAERLVMELDMDDLDPVAVQSLVSELSIIRDDGSLESMLGPEAFAQAADYAAAADISMQSLARAEPWYAAIVVEQKMLLRIGFNPEFGIESHLAERAVDDGKQIDGLETMRQQLELLDGLSADAQRSLLLQSFSESLEMGQIMDEVVQAWRTGNTGFLEDTILDDMRQYPELYRALVLNRNTAWVESIDALLDDGDDYLIIVGALHLIGDDGIPALMQRRGRNPVQLRQPDD